MDKPPYTSKIIKAGALLPDTKTFLSVWNPSLSVAENLDRIHHHNLLGKTSRSRTEDILTIFRQRYLREEAVASALAILVKQKCKANTLHRILYFHAARADALLHDVVIHLLVPQLASGIVEINGKEIELALKKWVEEGKTAAHWKEYTILRVRRGVLSTLRDFGVLQGAIRKRIAPGLLPVQAFAYVAFYIKQRQPSGSRLLEFADWKLFFLAREGVERFLMEAHQRDLLEYYVAGNVTRLSFPAKTLEEYANVIAA